MIIFVCHTQQDYLFYKELLSEWPETEKQLLKNVQKKDLQEEEEEEGGMSYDVVVEEEKEKSDGVLITKTKKAPKMKYNEKPVVQVYASGTLVLSSDDEDEEKTGVKVGKQRKQAAKKASIEDIVNKKDAGSSEDEQGEKTVEKVAKPRKQAPSKKDTLAGTKRRRPVPHAKIEDDGPPPFARTRAGAKAQAEGET